MTQVKLILFDFDKTLSKGPKHGYVYRELLKKKHGLDDGTIDKISELDKASKPKYYSANVSLQIDTREKEAKLHKKVYSQILKELHVKNTSDITETMNEYRMNELRHEVDDDVIDLLKYLKKRFNLAIFTNALPSRDKEIKDTGIDKYFNAVYISNLLGAYKPQKEFFDIPAREFSLGYNEMLLVDDKSELIEEAKKLGVQALLVDKKEGLEKLKKF